MGCHLLQHSLCSFYTVVVVVVTTVVVVVVSGFTWDVPKL